MSKVYDHHGQPIPPANNNRPPRRRAVLWVAILLVWIIAIAWFLVWNR